MKGIAYDKETLPFSKVKYRPVPKIVIPNQNNASPKGTAHLRRNALNHTLAVFRTTFRRVARAISYRWAAKASRRDGVVESRSNLVSKLRDGFLIASRLANRTFTEAREFSASRDRTLSALGNRIVLHSSELHRVGTETAPICARKRDEESTI